MKSVLRLATPVALSYLGLMLMGFVDTLILGRLGAAEVGGAGAGNSILSWVMVTGIGLITGMEFPCASAIGAGQPREAYRTFTQGHLLGWILGFLVTLLLWVLSRVVPHFGFAPQVAPLAARYVEILAFSMIPVFGFHACRAYLQSRHIVVPIAWLLVIANVANLVLNIGLIWGQWGLPALGFEGSAWATLAVRILMYFIAFGLVLYFDRKEPAPFLYSSSLISDLTRLQGEVMRPILTLGAPGAAQMALEVGVFALATALAARFSATELASHQIVLTLASVTFMVPLGISSAAATLVGHALGAGSPLKAAKQGWRAFQLGWIFNLTAAFLMVSLADPLLALFTREAEVIALGKSIILVAGLFQLSDGTQVIATGALRGAAETRISAWANLFGHWAVGFPISIWLAFYTPMRVLGLWIGLALGLTVVALLLLYFWKKKTRSFLDRAEAMAAG